jgi:acetoin utilization protein AcuC
MDEVLSRYSFGAGHPFSSQRYITFSKAFYEHSFDQKVRIAPASLASMEDLLTFHDPGFIQFVQQKSQQGLGHLDYGDTPAVRGIHEAAQYVVGTALSALDDIMAGITDQAFVPIGGLHHSKPKSASGFCVYNDVGIVIKKALEIYKLNSILYVDIDAHFGDGVYYAFESEPRVFTFDWHQEHIFPGCGFENETGKGLAQGHKKNICLKAGIIDEEMESFLQDLKGHRPVVLARVKERILSCI